MTSDGSNRDGRGLRVLIVEDNFLLASGLKVVLERFGARVLGPVANVDAALELVEAEQAIDGALLDVKLGDELVFPVADALRSRGIRYAFLTGFDSTHIPSGYRDDTIFTKTVDPEVLWSWLQR
jgi:DNA-binding response OmpR family regulator